jgi:dihydrofolate reductase
MGRLTFDSIGRPLPGRRTIVVSRNPQWSHDGCERAGSLDEAIALCQGASEVFIVGTAAEVTPVGEIGEFRFTPGNLSLSLMEDYASLVRRQPAMA